MAATFALILSGSFVLIGKYGRSANSFGVFYARTAVAFICAGWLNDRALKRSLPCYVLAQSRFLRRPRS